MTADHAHTFSMGGYPDRFADITAEVIGKSEMKVEAMKKTLVAEKKKKNFFR